jgi:tetratricopeptide (TPR) repeat protein
MTLLAAALLAATQPAGAPAPLPETEEGRAAQCQVAARRNPQAALANANRWRAAGGGLHARQCIGLAYVELEQWRPAATTFEQAAQEADRNGEARGADFWVQAGNAWLAGGDPVRAVVALDTALKSRHLTSELRGEVRLDRARALVAQNKLAEARTDLDTALQLVPADPMAWYLSAELARRQKDLPRARADINRALEMARENPEALLLAGTIAGQAGDMAEAERLYRQVAERAPNTDAGRAARASLGMIARNGAPPPPPPPAAPQQN